VACAAVRLFENGIEILREKALLHLSIEGRPSA
jgi:hypothetical protein